VTSLPDKILAIDAALVHAGIPHAFGGALALAWCTQRARGTVDIDLNVFAPVEAVVATLDAMPREVMATAANRAALARDGQVRLWWDETPVDLFMNTTEFHEEVAARARRESFAGRNLPFLSCTDLAVFKAFFNRTRDWADLEEMADAGTLDVDRVVGILVRYLGAPDERIERAARLGAR
jgi:hypothetical protein